MKGFLYFYKQSFTGKKSKKLYFKLDGDTLSWSENEGFYSISKIISFIFS